jgi:predicted amidohydrolase YtcJ
VPADDPAIRRAIDWIKTHQRQSGYWYTRSPKINDVLSTYAGSAYAVFDDTVGVLAPGKKADFVVLSHLPEKILEEDMKVVTSSIFLT